MQFDPVPADRRINLRLDTWPVGFRAAALFGAEPVYFINNQRNQLTHTLEWLGLFGWNRRQREEVLKKSPLQGKRIFTANLQIEDIELMASDELQRDENGLSAALWPQCFLEQLNDCLLYTSRCV